MIEKIARFFESNKLAATEFRIFLVYSRAVLMKHTIIYMYLTNL